MRRRLSSGPGTTGPDDTAGPSACSVTAVGLLKGVKHGFIDSVVLRRRCLAITWDNMSNFLSLRVVVLPESLSFEKTKILPGHESGGWVQSWLYSYFQTQRWLLTKTADAHPPLSSLLPSLVLDLVSLQHPGL